MSSHRSILKRVMTSLKEFITGFFKGLQEESVSVLTLQYLDLENTFLTLVLGGLVGLPLAPLGVSIELAPLLKDEIHLMEKRHFLGSDVLAEYFSELGGEW